MPGQFGPVSQAAFEDLAHSLLGPCQCQVNEAVALGEIPSIHQAQHDAGHLDGAHCRRQLGVNRPMGMRFTSSLVKSSGAPRTPTTLAVWPASSAASW